METSQAERVGILTTNTITVSKNYPATQLVTENEGPVYLVNSDVANPIYVGDTNSIEPADLTRTVQINPGDAFSVDGTSDLFAIVPGSAVAVKKINKGTNFTPGVATPQELASITGLSVTTNPPAGLTIYNVAGYASYDIAVYFHNTLMNTVGSQLVMPVILTWYADAAATLIVYQERWDVWISGDTAGLSNNACVATGYGPMHGAYMTVGFWNTFNVGPTNPVTCDLFNLYGSSRIVDRSIWKQAAPDVVSNGITRLVTSANPAINNNLFNEVGINLAASAALWIPVGLFAGLASVHVHVQTAALANAIAIAAAYPENLTSGGVVPGTGTPGVLYEFPNDTSPHDVNIALPKCPTYIAIRNGTTPQTVNFSVTAQEAA